MLVCFDASTSFGHAMTHSAWHTHIYTHCLGVREGMHASRHAMRERGGMPTEGFSPIQYGGGLLSGGSGGGGVLELSGACTHTMHVQ